MHNQYELNCDENVQTLYSRLTYMNNIQYESLDRFTFRREHCHPPPLLLVQQNPGEEALITFETTDDLF